ncbi:tyrosine-type recombinase/integrase [Mesorhizobium sp.]|uniref:tyrosine-type recombinase/integrase n=1 Tax=Mesorhizobium sp. TaxID=1871066 RepID=UPI0025E13B69|nr:tyrosine-type recombinase/integrase [Mesorhizobium sp.]
MGSAWRLRFVEALATCDLSNPLDLRDRAALLLLARLGLRAGDVRGLRLDDFDWSAGAVRVCGKSRRSVRLPLPRTSATRCWHTSRTGGRGSRKIGCSCDRRHPIAHS